MRSSTSNSDQRQALAAVRGLLGAAVLLGVLLEAATLYGVPRINHNQRRIQEEYRAAISLGRDREPGRVDLLVLGNSLTLRGIDMPLLQAKLGARCRAMRWAVDATGYFDWYFGLKRLFRAGARPDVILLGARSYDLGANHPRGSYFARHMLDRGDLGEAAAETGANATEASEMLFANQSAFYGQRPEINKKLLCVLLPDFPRMAERLQMKEAPLSAATCSQRLGPRLTSLKALCAAHGARLIVWTPPHTRADQGAADELRAGGQAGVDLLVPVRHNEIPPERFLDGEHLAPAGAVQLTTALAPRLRPLLFPPTAGRLASGGSRRGTPAGSPFAGRNP